MNRIRFVLLALLFALLLSACERPAPEGEVPSPSDNPDIVPRSTLDFTTPDAALTPETADATPTPGTDTTTDGTTTDQPTDDGTLPTATPETTTATDEESSDAPPLENGVYTVRAGDTLGQIAFIYGLTVEEIMAANNLANPDVLDVGQQIIIPEAGSTTTAPSPTQAPGSTDDTTGGTTTGEQTHTVQAGDNLYRIGLQYGFTVDELAEYNNLTNVNSLVVGQAIRIPPRN